jgi:hypothetical protein
VRNMCVTSLRKVHRVASVGAVNMSTVNVLEAWCVVNGVRGVSICVRISLFRSVLLEIL